MMKGSSNGKIEFSKWYILGFLSVAIMIGVVFANTNAIVPVPENWQGFAYAGQHGDWFNGRLNANIGNSPRYIELCNENDCTAPYKEIVFGEEQIVQEIKLFLQQAKTTNTINVYGYDKSGNQFLIASNFPLSLDTAEKCNYAGCSGDKCEKSCSWNIEVNNLKIAGIKLTQGIGVGDDKPDYFGMFFFVENTTPECRVNSDCGLPISELICQDDDVYNKTTTPLCLGGECSSNITIRLVENCALGCSDGRCIRECETGETETCGTSNVRECKLGIKTCNSLGFFGVCVGAINPVAEICDNKDNDCDGEVDEGNVCGQIVCNFDSDCGTPGCVGGLNYCSSNSVFQDFRFFTCHNPGEINSYCSNFTSPFLLENCSLTNKLCENGFCVLEQECTINSNCGVISSSLICHGNVSVNKTIAPLCENNECRNNITIRTVENCLNGCYDGRCLPGPVCTNNSQCGNRVLLNNFCIGKNVTSNYSIPLCLNGSCGRNIIQVFNQSCAFECSNGICVMPNQTCVINSDCGNVSSSLICSGKNVVNRTTTPTCENSVCKPIVNESLVSNCTEQCLNGKCVSDSCDDNNKNNTRKILDSNICGDGFCDAGEDDFNCYEDCKQPVFRMLGSNNSAPYISLNSDARSTGFSLLPILLLVLSVILVIIMLIALMFRKK